MAPAKSPCNDSNTTLPAPDSASEPFRSAFPRRAFLKGGTGVLVVAGLGPVVVFGVRPAAAESSEFSRGWFEARRGEWFHIDVGSWDSVELVEVEPVDVSARADQFTVTFRGSPHLDFEEGIYTLSPPDGSTIELHLQPVGEDDHGPCYQASFSILKPVVPACAPVESPA